jgi:hypothetical protein
MPDGRAFDHGIIRLHLLGLRRRARRAAARATVVFLFLGAGHRPLFLDQRLTVGDRDLVVIRVDFGEGQETVAVAAIFHEGRLQRGFDPRHLGQVDVPASWRLFTVSKSNSSTLFPSTTTTRVSSGMGGVDKHFL